MCRFLLSLVALALAALPGRTLAQGYPVTAGEHDGFTRVVVHAPPGVDWFLVPDGRIQRLEISPARTGFDTTRLFDRIARTRLADAQSNGTQLALRLECDCPITAWEERPGLIVLDIADPPASAAEAPDPRGPTARGPTETPGMREPPPVRLPSQLSPAVAETVGAALARRHVAEAEPAVTPRQLPDRDSLILGLGLPLAHALSQGLLDPAAEPPMSQRTLLTNVPDDAGALLDNLRITSVLDRADPSRPPQVEAPPACPSADALAFLTRPTSEPFATAFARLSRGLYGEFDQPDRTVQQELLELYLSAGFGAEARRILDAGADPIPGRDLLLGVADVLEGRNSNSRMRLAQAVDCGGPASIFALLAGAEPTGVDGPVIALTFSQLPARLRAVIGTDLAERLIAAGAQDAARIIAESMRRSPWGTPASQALVDAAIARARGLDAAAAARLEQLPEGRVDSRTVQRRLNLALEADQAVADAYLDGAEALASAERGSENGPQLMAAVIRLHARDGALDAGFAALDRLASWLPETSENRAMVAELTETLWRAMGERGDDHALVRAILERADWQPSTLVADTRRMLAVRLMALGLAQPVIQLLPNPGNALESVLRARAALDLGNPEDALSLLDGHDTIEARITRAAALDAAGRPEDAMATFAALGAPEPALRAAIAARDWDMLRDLQARRGGSDPDIPDLTRFLGRAPGQSVLLPAPFLSTSDNDRVRAVPRGAEFSSPPQIQATPAGDANPAPAGPEDRLSEPPSSGATPQIMSQADASPGEGQGMDRTNPASPGPPEAAPVEAALVNAPVDFDQLGLVSRGAVLLSESERLREAITDLLGGRP